MARTHYNCSPERFIEVWQRAKSSDEAAQILGMPKAVIAARAAAYRQRGVHLKKMPHVRKRLDVEGLNRMIEGMEDQELK